MTGGSGCLNFNARKVFPEHDEFKYPETGPVQVKGL